MTGIEPLISLIIYLVVFGILIYILIWILGLLNTPQPVRNAILLLIALIFLIWILRTLGIFVF